MNLTRQLTIILAVCIFLTAMTAIVPAYVLVRNELEQQVKNRLNDARLHSQTILDFEQAQLQNVVMLASQRPTLRRHMTENNMAEIENYLTIFRQNTELDELFISDSSGKPLLEASSENQSALYFADTQPVADLGYITGRIWLDSEFATRLSQQTGLVYHFLTDAENNGPFQRMMGDQLYYGSTLPFLNANNEIIATAEILLPVSGLLASGPQILMLVLAVTMTITLAASVAGGLYIRKEIRPLWKLTAAARRMSEGDLVTPVQTTSTTPETRILADTLEKSRQHLSKTLDELSRAKDWSDSLIRSIGEGIIIFDSDNQITFFSEGAVQILDMPADEAIGQPLDAVLRFEEQEPGFPQDYIPPEGSRRTVKLRINEQRSISAAITRAKSLTDGQTTIVLHDVTDEVEHRSLQAYFLANVSHEFRTPLAGMKVSIELLLENFHHLSPAEVNELLNSLHLSVSSLNTLVDNLLESGKIEANHLVLRRRTTAFNDVLSEAIRMTQPFLNRRQQVLDLEEPLTLPTLSLDGPRLIQVLVNLLSNASKYSPMTSVIGVRVEQQPEAIRVTIEDQGEGIPEERRQDIFRRFVRLGREAKSDYGSGLGLAVVKAIVEAHGGQVGVNARQGNGSAFWFTLPVTEGIS